MNKRKMIVGKKLILGLGTIASVGITIPMVVSCGTKRTLNGGGNKFGESYYNWTRNTKGIHISTDDEKAKYVRGTDLVGTREFASLIDLEKWVIKNKIRVLFRDKFDEREFREFAKSYWKYGSTGSTDVFELSSGAETDDKKESSAKVIVGIQSGTRQDILHLGEKWKYTSTDETNSLLSDDEKKAKGIVPNLGALTNTISLQLTWVSDGGDNLLLLSRDVYERIGYAGVGWLSDDSGAERDFIKWAELLRNYWIVPKIYSLNGDGE